MIKGKLRKPVKGEQIAPGLDAEEALEKEASSNDIQEGDYTKVTQLVYDEYDPSAKK